MRFSIATYRAASWMLVLVALLGSPPASAQSASDKAKAKQLYATGVTEFNLGHYAEAAKIYEEAYRALPDPVLLFNAAQAHRLAGHKEEALKLYASYLHNYGERAPNAPEVQRHIANLQTAISDERAEARAREEAREKREAEERAAAAAAERERAAQLVTPPPPPPEKPLYKKAWFWGVVGGGVAAVALGVGLGVGLGAGSDPKPTFGVVQAQVGR
jgi:tetratricopeptide (TPR) repeat protein